MRANLISDRGCSRFEKGAAAVEFALISVVFFMLLLGAIEWGRILFVWNSAVEATHVGARTAVVCNMNSPAIIANMQNIMPSLETSQVGISYLPAGCDSATCQRVVVSIQGFSITPAIPFFNLPLTMPTFSTSLVRESMSSSNNPVCS